MKAPRTSKLTQAEVESIRDLLYCEYPVATIAKRFNVSNLTITRIRDGNTWGQLRNLRHA